MSSTVTFTASMENALQVLFRDVGADMIGRICSHFDLDVEEATRVSGLNELAVKRAAPKRKAAAAKSPKDKHVKPEFPLPFYGVVNDNWCLGIKLNSKLHNQCTNKRVGDGDYCKTCAAQAERNASKKPNYGDIRDRVLDEEADAEDYLEYKDHKGAKTIPYANFLNKKNITAERAIEEAKKFGFDDIPDAQFVVREVTRGRKPKDGASTTSSGSGEAKSVGRPRGSKKTASTEAAPEDDLVGALRDAKKTEVKAKSPKKATVIKTDDADAAAAKAEKKAAAAAKRAATIKAKKEAKKAKEEAEKKAKEEAEKKAKEEAEAFHSPTNIDAVESENEDEEEGFDCEEFEHGGVTYAINKVDNLVYDLDTEELVGKYNEKTDEIEACEED
tara:strand:+ start:222 stop:1385 length:1164 start_codon:yes stop_codon:yes gene_type:complete